MKNVGLSDARIRWVLGLSLFVFSFFSEGASHWVLMAAGVVLLVTAFLRFCPIWFGLRISTHPPSLMDPGHPNPRGARKSYGGLRRIPKLKHR